MNKHLPKAYELSTLITSFSNYLVLQERTPLSVKKSIHSIKMLLSSIDNFDFKSIKRYIDQKSDVGVNYKNSIIYSVRIFSRFLSLNDYEIPNKLINFPEIKDTTKRQIKTGSLTNEEVQLIISSKHSKNTNPDYHRRWNIFFAIIAYTGLRPGEVAKLLKENIDLSDGSITTSTDGSLNPRKVAIPTIIAKDIRWIYIHTNQNSFLFHRRNNNHKFENSVNWNYNFEKRLRQIGLTELEQKERGITVLSLRNYFIKECTRRGIDFLELSHVIGHGDVRTTLRYLENNKENSLKKFKKIF